ncbi:MAG: PaaI family thioesterase [Syntrophomonadaceae bacterium]|nr:PaaI family thioesterase [Syntrophomonadaceae bacterium]MDH7496883.1 PaaI family thioesterase [Syntrophomonadaceae bacterium]
MPAGELAALVATACGYAASTLMLVGSKVLTVEYKVNLLSPAVGREFVATGRVVRAGRSLSVCAGEWHPEREGVPSRWRWCRRP